MAEPVVRLTIEGLPATIRKLGQLPFRMQKRAMAKAIRAGGNVFVKAAKRNAPRATGLFKRSLDQKVKSYRGGQIVVSITGQKSEVKNRRKLRKGRGGISGRGDLVPIHFVEEDTKPHRIPKEGRGPITLQLPSGQRVTVQSVQHPGTRGTHPIRRAADSSEGAAATAFGEKLRIETDAEVAKLARER
jgi:hypothetical protein